MSSISNFHIVIHGNNDGYRELYYTWDQLSKDIAQDITIPNSSDGPVGVKFYSIAFLPKYKGYYFTKYLVIKDTLRQFSTGIVGFSVFLDSTKKMSGKDMKSLLDELLQIYEQNYIRNNCLNKAELVLVQTNWNFVSDILSQYSKKIFETQELEEINPAELEAAYIYTNSDEEIENYLNAPFEEDYFSLKRIFFIPVHFKGTLQNPLNLLNHNPSSDLTDKVNPYLLKYRLKDYNENGPNGVKLSLLIGGKKIKNKEIITNKDELSIEYSKKYYDTKIVRGKLLEDDVQHYVELDERNRKIRFKNTPQLSPIDKKITFDIKDKNESRIYGTEIKIGNSPWEVLSESQYSFKGDDIGKEWKIHIRNESEHLISEELSIKPEEINSFGVTLKRRKSILINVTYHNESITKYNIFLSVGIDKKDFKNQTVLIFKDDEIDKNYVLEVTSKFDKKKLYWKNENFCPKNFNGTIEVKLEIPTKEIESKEQENKNQSNPIISKILGKMSDAKVGNTSTDKEGNHQLGSDFISSLGRIKRPLTYILSIIVLVAIVWFLYSNNNSEDEFTSKKIEQYINGSDFRSDSLLIFSMKWIDKQEEVRKPHGGIFSFFQKRDDTLGISEFNRTLSLIKEAQRKRDLIDKKNFSELLQQTYSDSQQNFLNVIEQIDQKDYEKVNARLGDVGQKPLNEITNSIQSILDQMDIHSPPMQLAEPDAEESISKKQEQSQSPPTKSNKAKVPPQPITPERSVAKPEEKSDGRSQTNSNTHAGSTLSGNRETNNNQIGEGEKIEEFIILVKSKSVNIQEYRTFLNRLNRRENKALYDYVKKISKNAETFEKYISRERIDRISEAKAFRN